MEPLIIVPHPQLLEVDMVTAIILGPTDMPMEAGSISVGVMKMMKMVPRGILSF